MKEKYKNIILILILITIFFMKDKIYLLMDNEFFYPEQIYKEYCPVEYSDEYKLDYDYILTRVLYKDIYNFNKEITIYKGSNYLFKENMAITDENGLVGIINNVNKTTSQVTLLTNNSINLSVKVNESYGLLKYENNNIIITNLTGNNINVGDAVYTSGLANLYPNIPVGKIMKEDISYKNKTYIISLFSDMNNMDYLYVLNGVK